jgi:hypothetical protein
MRKWQEASMTTITITTDAVLTTDHAASSYGRPVLVVAGVAYGAADVVTFDFKPDAFLGLAGIETETVVAGDFVRRYLPSAGDKRYDDATAGQIAAINADRRDLRAAVLKFLGE